MGRQLRSSPDNFSPFYSKFAHNYCRPFLVYLRLNCSQKFSPVFQSSTRPASERGKSSLSPVSKPAFCKNTDTNTNRTENLICKSHFSNLASGSCSRAKLTINLHSLSLLSLSLSLEIKPTKRVVLCKRGGIMDACHQRLVADSRLEAYCAATGKPLT